MHGARKPLPQQHTYQVQVDGQSATLKDHSGITIASVCSPGPSSGQQIDFSGGVESITIDQTFDGTRFPRTQTTLAQWKSHRVTISETYAAPVASIEQEGLKISDPRAAQWLAEWRGSHGEATTTTLDDLAQQLQDELRKTSPTEPTDWQRVYELAGRRINGSIALNDTATANFFTGYQRWPTGELKRHHTKPPDARFNPFRWAGELVHKVGERSGTLEKVDLIGPPGVGTHPSSSLAGLLCSYRCGCFGYSESADLITLGGWAYGVGIARQGRYPTVYRLFDASGKTFVEIRFAVPSDRRLSNRIEIMRYDASNTPQPLAQIAFENNTMTLDLFPDDKRTSDALIEELDTILAMMPTQVIRGDGRRDSRLGEVERWVDIIRFAQHPSTKRLSELLTDVDPATAPSKIDAFLKQFESRFLDSRSQRLPPEISCDGKVCKPR